MSERVIGILIGAGVVSGLALVGFVLLWWMLLRWEQRR